MMFLARMMKICSKIVENMPYFQRLAVRIAVWSILRLTLIRVKWLLERV